MKDDIWEALDFRKKMDTLLSSARITLCLDHRLCSFWISCNSSIICIGFADSPTLVALRLRITLDIIIMHGYVDPHALVSFVLCLLQSATPNARVLMIPMHS